MRTREMCIRDRGKNCFYVEAIEPGTIDFYSTYRAPQSGNGHWELTGIDDFEVDWGKNPDGTKAYIEDVVAKANAAGSKTLSLTGIDENNLIKTFTWFKDGIYWVDVYKRQAGKQRGNRTSGSRWLRR